MALYNARLGDVAASRQQLQRLRPVAGQQPHVWFRLGLTYELLNERTAALDAVRLALRYGYPAGLLAAEPDLLALRADPRFDTISSTNHKAIQ
jgi:serine/threonine-protein kinase